MKISIDDLNLKGFIFKEYPVPENFQNLEILTKFLLSYIPNILSIPGENLYYDVDCLKRGDSIKPHFHTIPGSFQVVCWVPEGNFLGRDFIYGRPDSMRRFRPKLGHMCFMKSNDCDFIHGVTALESDIPQKTLGFSSMVIPFKKNGIHDVYLSDYKILD